MKTPKNPKNILFFFTDDQRFDTIAALGNPQIKTPYTDKLVEMGTTFTRAHIQGGTSPAVCMPSRAILHSGRTLFRIEREGQNIPKEHTTIGEHLRDFGYDTYGIGKWHNGRDSFARSFSGGAEIFFGGMDDHWNVPVYDYDPTGKYVARKPYIEDPFYSSEVRYRDCDRINAGKHSTELFSEAAIDIINNQDKNNPFFLYVSLMAPHDPRSMPEKFKSMYDAEDIELPPNFAASHGIDTGALKIRDELLAAWPRDKEEIKRHIAEYYAMITHLDYEFGKTVDCLEKNGLYEDTIIIFAGDNGLAVGQHGLMGKQNLYEHSLRVPLIFAGPDIPQGKTNDSLVYLSDIYPTICDMLGVDIPQSVDGISLHNAITTQENESVRDCLYLAYNDTIRAVSDGDFKLIEYAAGNTQLFDLKEDKWEMNNLAANQAFADILQDMRATLIRLSDEYGDSNHPKGRVFWSKRQDLTNSI